MSGDFLAVSLDGRHLGLPALRIREVVRIPKITPVPGAPGMVAGVMNLRGQLVTAIDLRAHLRLSPRPPSLPGMAVLAEHGEHVYALIVDTVGDVVAAKPERQEPPPRTLAQHWSAVVSAVQRDEVLTLILDIDAILDPAALDAAA